MQPVVVVTKRGCVIVVADLAGAQNVSAIGDRKGDRRNLLDEKRGDTLFAQLLDRRQDSFLAARGQAPSTVRPATRGGADSSTRRARETICC